MTSKIDIKLKYRPNRCNLSDSELHSAKILQRIVILISLKGYLVSFWDVHAKLIISEIEFERADRTQNTDIVQH